MKNRLLVVVSVIIMVAISGTVHSETFTFSNNTPFIFNGTTLSSVLSASAVVGNVTDVNVTLNGLRVNNYFNGVEEFDVLLVGPQGTKIILLSFICDETPGPLDLTFDNAAVDVLPQGDTDVMCVSGTYLPSDYGAGGWRLHSGCSACPCTAIQHRSHRIK